VVTATLGVSHAIMGDGKLELHPNTENQVRKVIRILSSDLKMVM